MNLGKIPSVPKVPASPVPPATPPTHASQDVGQGPAQGNVGIGAPKQFDPNKPTVSVDATLHNPTGVGGDLHVQKDVPIPTHVPDVKLPSMGSGIGDSSPLSKSGGGLGLPDMPNLGLPSMPDISAPDLPSFGMPNIPSIGLPDMPSMPDMSLPSFGGGGSGSGGFGMPDMPSFGLPDMPSMGLPDMPSLGMPGLPSLGLPGLPSMGMPDIGLPGMPGFRFPDLPKFELPSLDLSDWDLSMPDLIPDWDGDSEEERQEPHKRAKHQEKLKVEISLTTRTKAPIPGAAFSVFGEKSFKTTGFLNNEGKAVVEIPKGKYRVEYQDVEDIQARSLAAMIHQGILDKDAELLASLFVLPKDVLQEAERIYNLHYRKSEKATMIEQALRATSQSDMYPVIEAESKSITCSLA